MTLLLADFVTFNQIHGMSGLSGIAPATFVTLLAATATQFARAGRLWEIEVCRAAGLVGNGPRHRRPSVAAVL